MGYRSPAIHRGDAYLTDCKCRKHYFAQYNEAKAHLAKCEDATSVYYNPQYGEKREVFNKEKGLL